MSLKKYLLGSAAVFGALVAVAPGTRAKHVGNQSNPVVAGPGPLPQPAIASLQSQVVQTQRDAAVTADRDRDENGARARQPGRQRDR